MEFKDKRGAIIAGGEIQKTDGITLGHFLGSMPNDGSLEEIFNGLKMKKSIKKCDIEIFLATDLMRFTLEQLDVSEPKTKGINSINSIVLPTGDLEACQSYCLNQISGCQAVAWNDDVNEKICTVYGSAYVDTEFNPYWVFSRCLSSAFTTASTVSPSPFTETGE